MAQSPISPEADNSMQALKQYGSYIITVILLALAGYFGWTYWQNNHARVDTVAADQYADIQQLNEKVNLAAQNPDLETEAKSALSKDQDTLNKQIDTLVKSHGSSVYAWQALMIKARQEVDNDDFKAASATLKQALAIDLGDEGLKAITRLRYAEALLAAGNQDAAMTEVQSEMPDAFLASQQILLGDIYLVKNDKEAAIKAYKNAWSQLSKREESRAVLALKMESLGISVDPIREKNSLIQEPEPNSQAQDLAVDAPSLSDPA